MSTPFTDVDTIFLKKVEQDRRFLSYFNLTDIQNAVIVAQQCDGFRNEAIIKFINNTDIDPELLECDMVEREFTSDLTISEKGILAALMFQTYYERNLAKLKSYDNDFTPTDLKVFSVADRTNSCLAALRLIKEDNEESLNNYSCKDRLTNKRLGIDYASYNTDE